MKHEKMTFCQALFTIVLFNFGSSVVIGISTGLGQDAWFATITGALTALPILCVYARILRLFPEQSLFEIIETLFGKFISKVFIALFVWYALHLCALVLRNFSEFTQVSSMLNTPQFPIMVLMVLTAVYLARSGARSIGKWSVVMILFVCFVVLLTFIASLSHLHLDDLMPFLEHSPKQLASYTFQIFSFPYAENVVFLCMANSFRKTDNPYKLFLYALCIILTIFLLVFVRNLMLLGKSMMGISYFSSYTAVRLIEAGEFFAKIEGSISTNFFFAGIVKITVCLLAASKGAAHLFNIPDQRSLLLPVSMLVVALCAIVYTNIMEMFSFLAYYPFYAFPFQVVLPFIIWIAGERYAKKHKKPSFTKPPNQQPDAPSLPVSG